MPIPYNKRHEYRLKLVEQLPPALRGKIALRNTVRVANTGGITVRAANTGGISEATA